MLTKKSVQPSTKPTTSQFAMGSISLNVANTNTQTSFYQNLVGLSPISQTKNNTVLGFESTPVLILNQKTDLKLSPRDSAGLYHLAILFRSRSTLAQTIHRLITNLPSNFSGSADHLVSEAFYFTDPEGNGVELYFDKDPSTWQWRNGMVVMDSLYLDPQEYINSHASTNGNPAKSVGHIHLKVGNLETALHFYRDILGLTVTAALPSALFLSDGKYHHYIGLNTWESKGAPPRTTPSLGLDQFTLQIGSLTDFHNLQERLTNHQVRFLSVSDSLQISDPWNNMVVIAVKKS